VRWVVPGEDGAGEPRDSLSLNFGGGRGVISCLRKIIRMKMNRRLFRMGCFAGWMLGVMAGVGTPLRANEAVEKKIESLGAHTITLTMQGVNETFQQEVPIGTVTLDLEVQRKPGKDGNAFLEVVVHKPLIGQTGNPVVVGDDGQGKRLTGPVHLKGLAAFVPDTADPLSGMLKLNVEMFDGGLLQYQHVFEYRVSLQRTSDGPPPAWASRLVFSRGRGEGAPAEEGKWGTFQKISGHPVFGVKVESKCEAGK
jgi:hypothetical protein